MNFKTTSKQQENLVRVAVAYATAMAERLYAGMVESGPLLAKMEEAVLAELHGLGNELLNALVGSWSEEYPAATIRCTCGEEAFYQRKRTGGCKSLLGTIQLKRAYYLCARCHRGGCPLADNGGPTLTHVLLPGSPAIDAGNPATPGSDEESCTLQDQRGLSRLQDGNGDGVARCDIGALELQGGGDGVLVITIVKDAQPNSVRNFRFVGDQAQLRQGEHRANFLPRLSR